MNSDTEVQESICEAFNNLSDECFGYLLECFHPNDLMMMKKLQFDKIISYLSSSLYKNISKVNILNCPEVRKVIELESSTIQKNEEELNPSKKSEREILNSGSNSLPYTSILISILFIVFFDPEL